ncbi:hypothetical protein JTB14_016329 [Gonioctena quinquepunctata]|nr:hypothetical protein JTB14_016329 [Gonioctena quinquepunctata]
MRLFGVIILGFLANASAKECPTSKANSKLFCYYSKLTDIDGCYCSHVILPANSDVKNVERVRQHAKGMKILVTVTEFNQGLIDILKTSKVDGLEINLKKLDSKNDISDFISTVRSKLGSDLYLALSVSSKAETLAKYYDFKALSKYTDVFILQTAFLGASKNVTFHPSRLSGQWDMQNTDSIVDLVSGLGAPLSKVVIAAPVQAFHFTLQNEEFSAPGSPALELKTLTRNELCEEMRSDSNWTLERDQDQAGPYIFSGKEWIAFEDSSSIDIKAKYSRVRGLAGLALKDLSQDGGEKCSSSILESAYTGLSRQARAPRGAVLHSLEREMVESTGRPFDNVQVSPYRITRIVDVEGHHHIIRQDTRTEFSCSRQGYFVHPRSCNRFYRCVKFDQLSDEYSVFEFDCPAGLAFDERVEVCVWPGSLPQGQACAGSSEIAPVPRERFVCPHEPGYYADPENCRWFFACLDHGKSPLSAYEFRCPFGLVFDSDRLVCEWSWLVPKCASGSGLGINLASDYYYGGASTEHGYQSGVVLDRYDGLGSLGVVKLGGINGKIEQPIIYSNIGNHGFQNGYYNGGFGLGVKATQSLQNAGLLKTNTFGGANIYDSNVQYNSGVAATQYVDIGPTVTNYQTNSDLSNAGYSHSLNTGEGIDASNFNIASNFGEKTRQNDLNQNAQFSSSISQGSGLYQSSLDQNSRDRQNQGFSIQYQAGSSANDYGTKSTQDQYIEQAGVNRNSGFSTGISQGSGIYHSSQGQYHGQASSDRLNQGSRTVQYEKDFEQNRGLDSSQYQTDIGSINFGVESSQGQYHGQASALGLNGGLGTVQYKNDLNRNLNANNVIKSSVNGIAIETQNQLNNGAQYQYNLGSNLVNANSGAKSFQTFSQYQGQNEQGINNFGSIISDVAEGNIDADHFASHQNGIAENINIVGGGYSAVGQSKSGVEIYNNGENNLGLVQTTAAPVTVTTYSSIPTVTSVPIPTLKTVTEFEHYNGGVIANIPELQYKIYGHAAVSNYSADSVKFISTTPSNVFSGYGYRKPTVSFVEGQTYQKPSVDYHSGSEGSNGGATSYNYQSQTSQSANGGYVHPVDQKNIVTVSSTLKPQVNIVESVHGGYDYPKPEIQLGQGVDTVSTHYNLFTPSTVRPVTYVKQPSANYNFHISDSQSKGYTYEKPSIKFEENPQPQVVVSTYNDISTPKAAILQPQIHVSSTVAPTVAAQPLPSSGYVQEFGSNGYDYPKPSFRYEEKQERPNTVIISKFSIRKPITQDNYIQTGISGYNYQSGAVDSGYNYERPSIRFEEKPIVQPAVITSYQKPDSTSYTFKDVVQSIVKPVQPVVSTYLPVTEKPLIIQQTTRPILSTYSSATEKLFNNQQTLQYVQPSVVSTYHYQKPAVSDYSFNDVVREPVQSVSSTYLPATEKTFIQSTPKTIVSTYLPATEKTIIVQKPASTYLPVTEQPFQLPEVVSSYSYVAPTTPKPISSYAPVNPPVIFKQIPTVVSTTPSPVAYVPRQKNAQFKGYDYPKPSVPFLEQPSPFVETVQEFNGYNYPRPSIQFEEKPASFVDTYENRKPVEEELFVEKTAYVTGNKPSIGQGVIENYQAPVLNQNYERVENKAFSQSVDTSNSYLFNNFGTVSSTAEPIQQIYVQSTPRPTYSSTIASVVKSQTVNEEPEFYYYDSRTSTAPKVSTEGYFQQKSEGGYEKKPTVSTKYLPVPSEEYLPVQSYTSKPISKFSFSSLDDQYQYVSNPSPIPIESTTPIRNYLPVRQRVKVTTTAPTFVVPEVTIPSRIRYTSTAIPTVISSTPRYALKRVTTVAPVEVTTLSREYLPVRSKIRVTTDGSPTLEEELEVTSRRPAKVVKVVRPAARTIIKQNDLQPFLSAKLGAQCTCISNSLNSKKKQKIIIVEDDDEDDDGYVVENYDQGGTVVENYQYEPQKTVDITPTPQIYIQSTTNDFVAPTPSYAIRRRTRVKAVSTTAAYELDGGDLSQYTKGEDTPSDKEIVKAVRTGLKLVKQAAKEGAKEGAEEVISKFNPRTGNVREAIECQRAGLFRHPNQCNKFYACRWDCTKNKFTLHSFNCPVHLTFDSSLGACNWPSQGPACTDNTLLPSE